MTENCPMRHENGNCIPAGGFCTANKNICEALLNAYKMGKAQLSQEGTTSDLISRQQALKALIYAVKNVGVLDANDIRTVFKALQTIHPEPHWIPVGERMPKDYVDVLVWFEYFRYGDYNCMYATHGIGNYSKEYNSWTINHETGWKDLHVFAWMPLPEPYGKEDGQDE